MTDLEQEMLRQIHELDKEVKALRERVAVLEAGRQFFSAPSHGAPPLWQPYQPPFKVTCGDKT